MEYYASAFKKHSYWNERRSIMEKEKFLKAFYDTAWEDILKKNPKVGATLKKLLTR